MTSGTIGVERSKVRPLNRRIPQLDHARRRSPTKRRRRVSVRKRTLSSLCQLGVPLGASHVDLPRDQRSDRPHLGQCDAPRHALRTGGSCRRICRAPQATTSMGSPTFAISTFTEARRFRAGYRARALGQASVRRSSRTKSAEMIRMLNSGFDGIAGNTDDYWRKSCAAVSKRWTRPVYDTVNDGVYKAGFATSQDAYDKARARCSTASTGWTTCSARTAASSAAAWPRPTGGSQPRSSGSTSSTTRTSSQPELPARLSQPLGLHARAVSVAGTDGTKSQRRELRPHRPALSLQPRAVNPHGIIPINPILHWDDPHGRGNGEGGLSYSSP